MFWAAITVTDVPEEYAPSPSVVLPAAGLEDRTTANRDAGIALKLATNVLLAVRKNWILVLVKTRTPFSV